MLQTRRAVLDTDVWTQLFLLPRRRDARVVGWRAALTGVEVAIAVQTRAETLVGVAAWGQERQRQARAQLDATATVPVDEAVVESYAALSVTCKQAGHALQAKQHTGDRWIAATAVAHGLPLLSGDGIFDGVPTLLRIPESSQWP